jgi:hypothetical protein
MIGADVFSPATCRSSIIRQTFGTEGFINQSVGSSEQYTTPTGHVFFGIKRTSSTAVSLLTNTTKDNTSRASVALQIGDFYELTSNAAGSPSSDVDTSSHTLSYCGSGAFNEDTLTTLVLNTFTALGV